MSHPSSHSAWSTALGRQLRHRWVVKTAGISLFMTLFFAAYFELLRDPARPVTTLPLLWLDRFISFQPWSLAPYLSLWIYVSLAPGLLGTLRALIHYAIASACVAGVGLAVFYLWPTAVPPPAVDWNLHPQFAFLKTIDAGGNACPSLHVAFATFTAGNLAAMLRQLRVPSVWRGASWAWAIAIIYSTLATKQHVAVDALAGAVLGGLGSLAYLRSGALQRNWAASGNTHA